MLRIGILSDTHGLLRPQALTFLQGSDHILHAGDIGSEAVLDGLRAIAPVTAIRGNNDAGPWAASLHETQSVRLGGVLFFLLHDIKERGLHTEPEGTQVVVCGHSHKPQVLREPSGLFVLNPGSAGPRRFTLPITAAQMRVENGAVVSCAVSHLL
jgi:putative phosphoesterase